MDFGSIHSTHAVFSSIPAPRLELVGKLRTECFRTSVTLPPKGAVGMRLFGETRAWDGLHRWLQGSLVPFAKVPSFFFSAAAK